MTVTYERDIPKLFYQFDTPHVPVPPSERDLQTIWAEPWFEVSKDGLQLEGLCFDREGNLYFLEVFGGRIMKLVLPEKRLVDIHQAKDMHPAAVKIHKDGRLFVCCLGNFVDTGCIFAMRPDGTGVEMIVPPEKGFIVDDLVFDSDGGFYFTDFKGLSFRPDGGVYYVSPDFKTITQVTCNMAVPNGVALSVAEDVMWVTETCSNQLTRVRLEKDRVTIPHYGTSITYRFTGFNGPDSCCIDREDNLYVAMAHHGSVMAFNSRGRPIGQILLPGRESGHMLRCTHPMFMPDSDNLVICSNDADGGRGSWLFIARGFAEGHKYYQFRD